MSKSPYTLEFRTMVSQEYLDGLGSYNYLTDKYGLSSRVIKEWGAKYRLYRIAAWIEKTYFYTIENKISIC